MQLVYVSDRGLGTAYMLCMFISSKNPLLKAIWAVGVIATIFLSALPADQMPQVGDLSDKIKHFLAYAVVGSFGMFAASTNSHRLLLAFAMAFMGLGLEGVQYFLPTRSFELLDALANTLGVVVSLGLYHLYGYVRKTAGG